MLVRATTAIRGAGAHHRWLGVLVAASMIAACGPSIVSTATFNPGGTGPGPTVAAPSAEPSALPTLGAPSLTPTAEPTPEITPVPVIPPHLNLGFQYMDLLEVKVNKLAVRKQPKRTAALIHAYDIFHDPDPADLGEVRLNSGDLISTQLGPLPIGDTTWYLVWGAEADDFHDSDWYAKPPFEGSVGPAWVATKVADKSYMTLQRHATLEEMESLFPLGVNAAGFGDWQSDLQPRHDGFLMDWAAAAPTQGTSCSFRIKLVPEDPGAQAHVALPKITTTSVKVAPLTGVVVNAPWLPIPDGAWDEFRVQVDSTCNWAVRLSPLHHD